MFLHQEPWVRGPPSKNLYQVLRGGSSYSRFLMREHSKYKTPPGGGGSFDEVAISLVSYVTVVQLQVTRRWCNFKWHVSAVWHIPLHMSLYLLCGVTLFRVTVNYHSGRWLGLVAAKSCTWPRSLSHSLLNLQYVLSLLSCDCSRSEALWGWASPKGGTLLQFAGSLRLDLRVTCLHACSMNLSLCKVQ